MEHRRLRFTLRLLFLAMAVVAIVLTSIVVSRESTINRANYNKIKIGMLEAEVDELLNQSPVDLVPLNFKEVSEDESIENILTKYAPPHTLKSWQGDRYLISICVDRHGRVASKYFERSPDASMLDQIADWLGI